MKFLSGAFESKKAAPSDAIARATGASYSARSTTYSIPGGWDVEQAITNGYERVMLVFRCVDAIASAQAGIPIIVRDGDLYDGPLVDYPDIIRLLNINANTYEDAWQFRYRLSSQLLLSRRGAFIEIIPSNSGGYAEIHLLPAGSVEPIPDPKKFVKAYRVQRSDWEYDELPPERVIWIRSKPHPTDPYSQMTPLVAAGLSVETDFLARLFNRNFITGDGRPGMLVNIKGGMNPIDAMEVKARLSGGYSKAGQTVVVEADSVDVQDMGATPRDLQWSEMIRGTKEDILLAFGTPESVLGNASGRTFDNADAEFEVFYIVTVKDHCLSITRPLRKLTNEDQPNHLVVHDFSKVEVMQRAEQKRRETKNQEFAAGVCTLDDVLKERGLDPLNVPASRVYFLPNGVVVATNPEDQKAVAALPIIGSPALADPAAAAQAAAKEGAQEGAALWTRQWRNNQAARALRLADSKSEKKTVVSLERKEHPYLADRSRLEGIVEGALEVWTDRQEKVVTDRLMHTKVRKGTRHWESKDGKPDAELKAIDPSYVLELDNWVNDLQNSLEGVLRKTARHEANRVARDLQSSGVLDAIIADGRGNPEGKTALDRLVGGGKMDATALIDSNLVPVLDIISDAASRQSRRIMDTIKEMDADGASLRQIKEEVRKMMSTRSSWHKGLATNVATATIEGMRSSIYGHAGNLVVKRWNSYDDEKTRESHVFADGQTRPANRSFKVGHSHMMFPGDPRAPIEERANCRCWLDWRVSEKAMSNRKKEKQDVSV